VPDDVRPPGSLDGVLVADFSRVLAGPLATMILGDLGAEVVKVEHPDGGDDTRAWGPPWSPDGGSSYYLGLNRNKRSVTLDLKDPTDLDAAKELARRADVVIENFRPGVMRRYGLDEPAVRATNAAVVYCSILGIGRGEVPGYEDVMRAANSSLQNMDVLLKRMDRIIAFVESGQGSVGKLIYDPALYNRVNATVNEFQNLVSEIAEGKGSIGKLIADDELYNKANAAMDKINKMVDDLNAGQGTAGKLLKDETLYKNLNQTVANAKQLTDDINAGKGAIGKMARDQEFANKLQNTLNRLSNLTDKLDEGNGSAALFLRDPAVYNNTNKLLNETQDLIKAIRQNPKKYLTIHLKLF